MARRKPRFSEAARSPHRSIASCASPPRPCKKTTSPVASSASYFLGTCSPTGRSPSSTTPVVPGAIPDDSTRDSFEASGSPGVLVQAARPPSTATVTHPATTPRRTEAGELQTGPLPTTNPLQEQGGAAQAGNAATTILAANSLPRP